MVVAASLCLLLAQDSGIDIGDITARKALRKQLQCKTFRWYLVSVYPEMRMYSDIIAYGVVRSPPLGFIPSGTCGRPVDKRLISGTSCEVAYTFIGHTSPFP